MPLHNYRCTGCGHEFETLVRSDDQPACPLCQGQQLERLIGQVAVLGKTAETLRTIRSQAAREGHFSNFSKAELKGK